MYGCERTRCKVNALQRSLPDKALSIVARGLWPRIRRADRSAERVRSPHDLGNTANAFWSCAGVSHQTDAKTDPRTQLTG
jgi:hypothetical protein